jgi:osmoprotectant transport system ATP-binding protein
VVPDGGQVFAFGHDVSCVDPIELRRRIGYVPQDGGLLPHWRVGRNVEMVLRLRREDVDLESRADAALHLVGLDPRRFRQRWPRELSGGQRQRVALARALAARPAVLLLDEPFGALDAISRADLQDTFAALRHEHEVGTFTALLVTHDLSEALWLADRVAVMRKGGVEQIASPEELVTRPTTPYVRELLARAHVTAEILTQRPAHRGVSS